MANIPTTASLNDDALAYLVQFVAGESLLALACACKTTRALLS